MRARAAPRGTIIAVLVDAGARSRSAAGKAAQATPGSRTGRSAINADARTCDPRRMPEVSVLAVRWVADDPQPGIVECHLVDADGTTHVLVDKSAIFDDADRLRADSSYPIALKLGCRVVRDEGSDLEIELAHHLESVDGRRTFRVPRSAVD